jgi:uncharacterized membrane protein YfcA
MMSYTLLIQAGVLVGVLSALLGIGGGLVYVPILALLGASPIQATATSLVAIAMGAVSGTIQNLRKNGLRLEAVSLMTFPAMLTTAIGVGIALWLPGNMLLLLFAVFQIAAIWLINMKNKMQGGELSPQWGTAVTANGAASPARPLVAAGPVTWSRDAGEVRSPASANGSAPASATTTMTATATMPAPEPLPERAPNRERVPVLRTQGIGLAAGVLSGLLGVGGGLIMVPMQVRLLATPIKKAIQNSYGAVVLISMWAVAQYTIASPSNIMLVPGLCLGAGSMIGAGYGARLLPKLPDRTVKLLFTVLLITLAVYMLLRVLLF